MATEKAGKQGLWAGFMHWYGSYQGKNIGVSIRCVMDDTEPLDSLYRWSWDVPKEVRRNPDIAYDSITDTRDNKVYKTVKIGSQTWMADNLNYSDSVTTPSLVGNSVCFGNDAAKCEVAGRLRDCRRSTR